MGVRTYSDLAGYSGMAITVLGYLVFAAGYMSNPAYFGVGIATSLLMGLHAIERKTGPMLALNVMWLVISLVGLGRAWL